MNDLERYMVKDRELLAHTMGYSHFRYGEGGDDCLQGYWCKNPDGVEVELPHPWVDANADYAVLEWVRTEILKEDSIIDEAAFHDTLADCFWMNLYQEPRRYPEPRSTISIGYQIGDYARAALKVIE